MRSAAIFCLGIMLGTAGNALAQEPASVPLFFAVGIPDDKLPIIDGDNTDWAWVDKNFEVTTDDMTAVVGGADDADDLFIDAIFGWNQSQNRLYGVIHVHDNALIIDKNPTAPWRDDGFEVFLDPNNSGGGPYADAESELQEAYQFCMYFSQTFERLWFYNGAASSAFNQSLNDFWWTHSGDFLQIEQSTQGQEYFWEFGTTLFDPMSVSGSGPGASTLWVLAPEQTIGLELAVSDADPGINTSGNDGASDNCGGDCPNGFFWQAYYTTSEQFTESAGISDFFLTPVGATGTAVEASSWGQLKALVRGDL